MTALAVALPPALAGLQPPPDGSELRALAARLADAAERLASAASQLQARTSRLPGAWTGSAACAALLDLGDLQERALAAGNAHREASHVLQVCAARLDEAAATWRRAESLERQDALERVAARPAPPWLGPTSTVLGADDSPLRRQARHLAEQAQSDAADAVARANAELHELSERAPTPTVARLNTTDHLTTTDHLAGLGRGAADAVWGSVVTVAGLSLPRLLSDPDGWRDQVRGLRDGASYAVGHPREAAASMIGWEQLQSGRYGEWAGGFVPDLLTGVASGGAVPVARRGADLADDLGDLADDVHDLQRVHGRGFDSNAGGPVVAGRHLPAGYVEHVNDLTPERRRHILDGDPHGPGGGHRHGAGRGKSEFPASWDDDLIISRVMQTARAPLRGEWSDKNSSFNVMREFDGVTVLVAIDRSGNVKTGYPMRRRRR